MIPSVARTVILYGDSGLGKSSNAYEFSKLAYEITKKPIRLIAREVSSQVIFQPLVDAGIVQPLYLQHVKQPLPGLRRLSRGDWPVKEGGQWKWKVWDDSAGAYVIEGLTSISEMLLEDGRDKQRMTAEQREKAFEETEGGEKFMFAKSSMSNFDFVQMEMLRNLQEFGGLPVWRLLWTAHEVKGEDEDTKAAIRGPGLVGKAKTAAVQKYCSVLLHLEGYPETVDLPGGLKTVKTKRRVWFTPHPDQTFKTITYPAKVTVPTERLADLYQSYQHGFFEPVPDGDGLKHSLADFLRLESALLGATTDKLKEWKAKVDAAQ